MQVETVHLLAYALQTHRYPSDAPTYLQYYHIYRVTVHRKSSACICTMATLQIHFEFIHLLAF